MGGKRTLGQLPNPAFEGRLRITRGHHMEDFFRHIWSSFHLGWAFAASRKRDFSRARHHMNAYFRVSRNPKPSALAFDATLLIREMKSASAHRRFAEAKKTLGKHTSDDHVYIYEFCNYYMCLYESLKSKDSKSCDHHRVNALGVNASSFLRKLLPLRYPGHE